MSVRRHGFHNGSMAHISQFGESTIHRIFMAWVVFIKAISFCLNLKPEDEFLPYRMPQVLNKTGNDLADFLLAWYEFKPVLQPEFF